MLSLVDPVLCVVPFKTHRYTNCITVVYWSAGLLCRRPPPAPQCYNPGGNPPKKGHLPCHRKMIFRDATS
jgi:hypothetical protein